MNPTPQPSACPARYAAFLLPWLLLAAALDPAGFDGPAAYYAALAGALVVGYLLISRVPQLLHTPLMSLTNAVSAVTVLGALLLFGSRPSAAEAVIGTLAVILAMFNVIGGLAITGRMLRFFKKG